MNTTMCHHMGSFLEIKAEQQIETDTDGTVLFPQPGSPSCCDAILYMIYKENSPYCPELILYESNPVG